MIKKNKTIYPNFKTSFLNSLNSEIIPTNPPSQERPEIEFIESKTKTIKKIIIESFPEFWKISKMDSLNDLIWVLWFGDSPQTSFISILNGRTLEILKTYDSWEINGLKEKIPSNWKVFDIDYSGNFNVIISDPITLEWTYLKTNNIFDYNKINNLIVISRVSFYSKKTDFNDSIADLNFHWNYQYSKIVSISASGSKYGVKYFFVIDVEEGERKLIQQFDFIENIDDGYTFNQIDPSTNKNNFTFIFNSKPKDRQWIKLYSLSESKDNNNQLILKLIDDSVVQFFARDTFTFLSKNIAKANLNNYPLIIHSLNSIKFYGQETIIDKITNFDNGTSIIYEKDNLIFWFRLINENPTSGIWIDCFINPFFQKTEKKYSFKKELTIPYDPTQSNLKLIPLVVKENNLNNVLIELETELLNFNFSYSNNLDFNEIPYFFLPIYNSYDFLNQRVKIFDVKNELIGDVDIIANIFTSNSLLYLIKLNQFSTNNIEMKKFDLITNNNNSMINFDASITKTRFENKNVNLNIVFKNIDNSNNKNLEMKEVSVDTVFAFSQNSSTQEKNIISVNFLKINFVDDSFKIFDFTKNNIGTIENDKFFIKKTILNSSKKIVKSISFHNKNILNEINNPFLNYEINLNPNEVLELSISGELKETI